jgi:DNA-binding transcriptional regulator YdaS (Cro superfamily)
MIMTKRILILGLLPLAVSCTQGPPVERQLSPRETAALAKALEGKVAGQPVSCIASYNSDGLRVLGNNTVLYRVNKDLVYKADLQGGCNGLSAGDALVINRTTSSQYCRGDMARSVHLPTGSMSGACAFGDFVPYRTPGK